MLKYVDTLVSFSEVPDEITLCINISNCPCHCKGCHSSYLAEDIGTLLNEGELEHLIKENKGITCIAFMGGDVNPFLIDCFAEHIKTWHYPIKTAWYSGRQELSDKIHLQWWDFIKLGPYIEDMGPLTSKTTNQKFYKVESVGYKDGSIGYELIDMTYKFHRNEN